jgi:hypothetical protein
MNKPSDEAVKAAREIATKYERITRWTERGFQEQLSRMVTDIATIIDTAIDAAKREQREASCWHCGVVLEAVARPRCEGCPPECDAEDCDELGCAIRKG